MSLHYCPQKTEEMRKVLNANGPRIFFKQVQPCVDAKALAAFTDVANMLERLEKIWRLCSPSYWYVWKPGLNKSGRAKSGITNAESGSRIVNRGFHLYVKEETSIEVATTLSTITLPVWVYPKDLVAVDPYGQCVVAKDVMVVLEDYQRALTLIRISGAGLLSLDMHKRYVISKK